MEIAKGLFISSSIEYPHYLNPIWPGLFDQPQPGRDESSPLSKI